jgi:thymidylate kinase
MTRRRGPGRLVAFSGMDGSGKSTQVELLREHLGSRGRPTQVAWSRLEWTTLWESSGALERIAAPVNWLLGGKTRVHDASPEPAGEGPAADGPAGAAGFSAPAAPASRAARLRRRSGLLTHVWVLVVAIVHARRQREAVRAASAPGTLVICDRYTLDAAVGLRRRYGEGRSFRLQVRLMEWLSPRPSLAWHVDVPAEVAGARKEEGFTGPELDRIAALYREERARLGWRRLDGRLPPSTLAAEVAEAVDSGLPIAPPRAIGR